jgi:hypothetical protein
MGSSDSQPRHTPGSGSDVTEVWIWVRDSRGRLHRRLIMVEGVGAVQR